MPFISTEMSLLTPKTLKKDISQSILWGTLEVKMGKLAYFGGHLKKNVGKTTIFVGKI